MYHDFASWSQSQLPQINLEKNQFFLQVDFCKVDGFIFSKIDGFP